MVRVWIGTRLRVDRTVTGPELAALADDASET